MQKAHHWYFSPVFSSQFSYAFTSFIIGVIFMQFSLLGSCSVPFRSSSQKWISVHLSRICNPYATSRIESRFNLLNALVAGDFDISKTDAWFMWHCIWNCNRNNNPMLSEPLKTINYHEARKTQNFGWEIRNETYVVCRRFTSSCVFLQDELSSQHWPESHLVHIKRLRSYVLIE